MKLIDKIFNDLEESKPQIKLVKGINNKEQYFHADRIFEILEKYLPEE